MEKRDRGMAIEGDQDTDEGRHRKIKCTLSDIGGKGMP